MTSRSMSGNINSVFYVDSYHLIQSSSIDGTDILPRDNVVYRAHLCSSAHLDDPFRDPNIISDPYCTLFVGRLNHLTTEHTLHKVMSRYGKVKNLRLVRHIVTGASCGYTFVEFESEREMYRAYQCFKLGGFRVGSISSNPTGGGLYTDTAVMGVNFRAFVEIVFENHENLIYSWHFDGYSFFVVGMDGGLWTPDSRKGYNLRDVVARYTTQVYPKSWTIIWVGLDNVGMWNIRSEFWARQYLGQQFYLRVYSPVESIRDEYPIPRNARICGKAAGRHARPL